MHIDFASADDVDPWLSLLHAVKNGFPGLNFTRYKEHLMQSIARKEALAAKIGQDVVGGLTFSYSQGKMTFLAVHPDHRQKGIARELLQRSISLFPAGTQLSVVTYREDDPRGVAARNLYQSIGFVQGELLTVFSYPCQKLTYTVTDVHQKRR